MRESAYNIWIERPTGQYVFNSLSGALLRATKEDARRSLEKEGQDPHSLAFRKGRFIIPDSYDEVAALRARYHRGKADATRMAITVISSLGCNFDCPYCYESKRPSILSGAVRKHLIEYLEAKLPTVRRISLHWLGGEPLIALDSVLELTNHFKEKAKEASVEFLSDVTTNGYLLTEEAARALVKVGISHAQVSLDGPPDVHDRMRPLRNGKGTFSNILCNVVACSDILEITVRVNADTQNYTRAEELLRILASAGLSGKITIYLGQLVKVDDAAPEPSPSASYTKCCFGHPEFAAAEIAFIRLAASYGFNYPALMRPIATPCTAVRPNELVIGSNGELYKCWENVGNEREVIGNIADWASSETRASKWLTYDPFSNSECLGCVALPVCMGGCAHHAFDPKLYDSRCSTFRHNYLDQVSFYLERSGH